MPKSIHDFTIKSIEGKEVNFADYKGKLKKDGTKMWHCPHKFPYNYFKLLNKDGELVKTSIDKLELENLKQDSDSIVEQHYKGCPHWNQKDDFDL